MKKAEALDLIRETLEKVTKSPVPAEFGPDCDLIESGILDSLDSMVFSLDLEQATGKSFPEDVDLVAEGYYKMPKLLSFLTEE